ncbi:MAG TPA: diacylglycerol kinase family protein [Thermomicrobiales bacterium]|nr:diacylglycerol kinase family protein [Thermomicrobiales bacterium]
MRQRSAATDPEPVLHVIPIATMEPGPGAIPRNHRAHRIEVIANPATRMSGRDLAVALSEWRVGLEHVTLRFTDGPGAAERLARQAVESGAADVVVAAGGDGTVGEVATGLVGTGIPLGIIPAGSTNIVAKELGIPARPEDALRLIAGQHDIMTMDLAIANDRAMLHMAGAGFDSRLFAMTDPKLKRRFGWGAYFPAGIRASLARPVRLQIMTEAESFEVESPLVLVANGASIIHRNLRIDTHPTIDDGLLDLYIVSATNPLPTIETMLHALLGGLGDAPEVIYRRVTSVHIESNDPLPYQVDGDVAGQLPLDISLSAQVLRVIVPPR